MKSIENHTVNFLLVSIDTLFVGVAEPEPFTITPYEPDVYVLFSKIGHPIGHLRVELDTFNIKFNGLI